MMKPPVVLDSWALLAWLQAEQPAAASVRGLLDEAAAGERLAVLSIINAGEVFYIISKNLGPEKATDIPDQLTLLPLEIRSVDDDLVWAAARLKARHRMSYADAFAAALALRINAVLVTGDPEFASVQDDDGLVILWLHRS
jgi:predicted nucleic acid-binding protein